MRTLISFAALFVSVLLMQPVEWARNTPPSVAGHRRWWAR
jgi:hypothetical protein